jgi:hypothetical protein
MEDRRGRYYSPSGERREKIKQEIIDAIHRNPNQDPSITVAENRETPVDPYEHLDIVLPLTEMARKKTITYSPKEGWKTEIPPTSSPEV